MFRFYKISSDDIIEKLLGEQATIRLSAIYKFNDPFEFKFNLDLCLSLEETKNQYLKEKQGSTIDDFLRWKKNAEENKMFVLMNEYEIRNNIAQDTVLCCFTEDNKSNLMWSHYTHNHEGICVEYKSELFQYLEKLDNFFAFGKVDYSDEPPTVKNIDSKEIIIKKIMFSKQSEWKYEKEHRIVLRSEKEIEDITIGGNFIKSVYIGSRCPEKIFNKILTICKNTSIEIYEGITLGKSYEVHFEKYKENGFIYPTSFWK